MLKNSGEIILSIVCVILLVVLVDPFQWTMPNEIQMIVMALVVAAFGLYSGLLYRQKPVDERDAVHIHKASRMGYIGGIVLLVIAITIQTFMHSLDPWLVGVLVGMVVIKMIVLVWTRIRN